MKLEVLNLEAFSERYFGSKVLFICLRLNKQKQNESRSKSVSRARRWTT